MNASLHCKLQEPTVPITAYCQDLCNGDTARFERRFTVMLSIIIPTYSEEGYIGRTLIALRSCAGIEQCEVLVVDGGSTDGTVREVEGLGIPVVHSLKGRAVQMNAGAANALGDTFYFLHAESVPPPDFVAEISVALAEGAAAGCFRLGFDHDHWFLRFNCWFTRFDVNAFRYGDQSLFVTKEAFDRIGGFKEELIVFEDNDIVCRLKQKGRFRVLSGIVRTSARKYVLNGVHRMQWIFYYMFLLYKMGCSQDRLVRSYRRLIKQDKI